MIMLYLEFCYDDVRILSYDTLSKTIVTGANSAILADYMLESLEAFMTDCVANAQGRLADDLLVSYHFYPKLPEGHTS